MKAKVYRTAIYARLSKEDGDKAESNSISSQKTMCEEYIRKHKDLELVETFVDDGFSGVTFERPGFRKMEQAIKDGKIEAVVCKDLSRFIRNYIDGGTYLQKIFPKLHVRFIAINDGYDSGGENAQNDAFVLPFKNLINDSYAKDISVKIRTSMDVKRRKGEYLGAFAPYGYRKEVENRNHLVVDETAGNTVRQIFSMYKDGVSIGRIADRLNELGILSPMEYKISSGSHFATSFRRKETARWSYTAVKRILSNEVYIGSLVQGKRGTPNYKVHVIQDKEQEEWVRVEGAVDPLVSYEDFAAVQTMLARDTRSAGGDSEENLYSGFIFCGDCGQPMTRKVIPSGKCKYYYYVCSTNKRKEGCTAHSISTKAVNQAVGAAVREQIANVLDLSATLDYLEQLPSANRMTFNYEKQISLLEDEIEEYKKRKLRLYEDLSDHVIDKNEYAEFRSQYTELIESKTAALERVRKESRNAKVCGDSERVWVSMFRKYENVGEISRRVLMALVDKIFVYEGHVVEISFKYKDEFEKALVIVEENRKLLQEKSDSDVGKDRVSEDRNCTAVAV